MHRHIQETLHTHTVTSVGNCVAMPDCARRHKHTQTHTMDKDGCDVMCCGSLLCFCFTAEQLPCQQSREAAGPQVHCGPPHQYHLLQNEGTIPPFIFVCRSNINIGCNELKPQFL